jgi:hypothetical protein
MSRHEEHFDVVQIEPADWKGLTAGEAYACGIEMGCFIQACSISRKSKENLRLRLPSERHSRAQKYLEQTGEDGKFYWINDDVMLVVIEREDDEDS